MISEPALAHDSIRNAIERLWGRRAGDLQFLSPGGECSWGYRIASDGGQRLFLKLSQERVCGTLLCERNLVAAAELARALGAERVIGAWRSRRGRFLEAIGPYQARLQPWVEGVAFMDLPGGPDEAQQGQLGELVADVHRFTPQQRPLPEAFAGMELRDWPRLQALVNAAPPADWSPAQQAVAALVRCTQPRMARWIADYHALERRVRAAGHAQLFCHGDPSSGNALVRPDGGLTLVDLDAPAWAPRERDLFHLRLWPAALAGYRSRFPEAAPDADLLRLYQLSWDIGEVVDYGWRALMTRQSEAQQQHDLSGLQKHLEEAA